MNEKKRTVENAVFLDLLPAVNRQLARSLSNALRPLRITPAQYQILQLLTNEGQLPPRKISTALSLDQSTIVSTLTRLERDGYVKRNADPSDGRSCLIYLTERAKSVFHEAQIIVQETVNAAAAPLGATERRRLHDLLIRLAVNRHAKLTHLGGL